jgi:flagellar basal body-associated protein FliL
MAGDTRSPLDDSLPNGTPQPAPEPANGAAPSEGARVQAPRSVPRKVELDIDELPEDLAVEVPETEERVEEAPAEPEPEKRPVEAPVRSAFPKLLVLFSGAVVLFLVLLAVTGFTIYRLRHPPQPVRPVVLPESLTLNLMPFVVNVSTGSEERLLTLGLSLTFSSLKTKDEFLSNQVLFRDRIYRFLLQQNTADFERRDVLISLQRGIAALVNASLTTGEVNLALLGPSKQA